MNNFSNKSTEEIKELYEDFDEIGKKLAEAYDSLAILHNEHRLDTMDIPGNRAKLSSVIDYVESAKNNLRHVAKKAHTCEDEQFLSEAVLHKLRSGNLSFHA